MTRSQLITLLVLVTIICLGSALLLLPERRVTALQPERLVQFAPSQVREVVVEPAGGPAQRLLRTGPDRWEIELPAQGEGAAVRWPAATERVHGFLRILDRLRAAPAEAPGAAPALWATIVAEGGERVAIGLPAAPLGGRAVVQAGPDRASARPLVTTDELNRLLVGPGLSGWLDPRVFAGIEGQPVEVAVLSGGDEMRLVRSGGGWRIGSPFEAAAEASLVQELLVGLQALPFTAADASVAAERSGAPAATSVRIVTEARRPAAGGEVVAEQATHELRTLGAPDAGGRIGATVEILESAAEGSEATAAGPLHVELDASRLTALVRQPAFYLARRVLHGTAGDIHGFVFQYPSGAERRWDRVGEGWAVAGAPVPPAGAAALDNLAALLTETPAPIAAWAGEAGAPGAEPVAEIACLGFGGAEIGRLALSVAPPPAAAADQRQHAVAITAGVARYYPPEAVVEILRWIVDSEP
ncbi:MAG TPA: hypothetical protein VFF69_01800 [Phycisphaerales bacterium]|nr:hypothetical protein [Phycisphaerales bacterium]